MSLTLFAWCCLFGGFTVLSFRRPVWGASLYFLTFFAAPEYWWWGGLLAGQRLNLVAGLIFLAATIVGGLRLELGNSKACRWTCLAAFLIFVNATAVHFFLAAEPSTGYDKYVLLAKFTVLFFLMTAAVRTREDFRIIVVTLVFGLAYLGYELMVNERGSSRLDGVGCPGAMGNGLANLVVVLVPLAGWLLFSPRKWEKALGAFSAIAAIEILGRCNTRAAFLALIGSACIVAVFAGRQFRRQAAISLLLGALCLSFMIARNTQVLDRFKTTFVSPEDRDASASSRLVLWECGWKMVRDYPLGSGAAAFKDSARGVHYKGGYHNWCLESGYFPNDRKAVHNGYINEAVEWGLQGLALKLLLIGSAVLCFYGTMVHRRRVGDENLAFFGVCGLAAMVAYMLKAATGDSLDFEAVYWIAVVGIAYTKAYGPASESLIARPEAGTQRGAWSFATPQKGVAASGGYSGSPGLWREV